MSLIMLTIFLLGAVGLVTSAKHECLAGKDCKLKCGKNGAVTFELLMWTREDLNPNVLLSYRSSDPAPKHENLSFKDRTKLSQEDQGHLNTTLTITNVAKTDVGNYTCIINPDPTQLSRRKRAASGQSFTVELVVTDQAEKSDTQNEDNTHPDAERGRIPLVLEVIAVMAAVGCVAGLIYRRRGFLGTANQPVRVPTMEQV